VTVRWLKILKAPIFGNPHHSDAPSGRHEFDSSFCTFFTFLFVFFSFFNPSLASTQVHSTFPTFRTITQSVMRRVGILARNMGFSSGASAAIEWS